MLPLETLDRVTTPDGTELVLYHRDGDFQIRIDGLQLMSSRAHGSEEALARLTCEPLRAQPSPRVLIGGLGMGYTLRAALDALPAGAAVEVAEFFPAVVAWNRGPLAHLAGRPLDDARTRVTVADVADLLGPRPEPYDAILLDVDNGAEALTLEANARLYTARGLGRLQAALAPRGVAAFWASFEDPAFLRRLERAGFVASSERVPARGRARGPAHAIYLGRKRGR